MNKLVKALDKKITLRASVVDIISGGVIFLLNLLLLTVGVEKYISEGYGNKYAVTPRTFPRAIFIAAMALAILVIIKGVAEFRKKKENEKTVTFRLISVAILLDMAFFVFTMQPLGYPIANMIMMIIMYWLSGGKSWIKAVLTALLFTTASILFFYYYLKLSVPMGLLSGLIK